MPSTARDDVCLVDLDPVLSVRSLKALAIPLVARGVRGRIKDVTLGDVVALGRSGVLNLRNFGRTSLSEIERHMTAQGMSWQSGPIRGIYKPWPELNWDAVPRYHDRDLDVAERVRMGEMPVHIARDLDVSQGTIKTIWLIY